MKTFVENREGNAICTVVERLETTSNLAFVMHGLGDNKDQAHMRTIIDGFLQADYTVVSFDTVHTFGESKGSNYENATVTNYQADLEDVISWAAEQSWYTEPFALCGHSLGGMVVALYAEKNSKKVNAIAPIATVISGELSLKTRADEIEAWQRDGIKISQSFDGKHFKRLKWSHMQDRLQYDLLREVDELNMPVLMIVGERDTSTPLDQQQILYERISARKELHIIPGALHRFHELHERIELKSLIKQWVRSI